MKKILRIWSLIQIVRQKRHLSRSMRRAIISKLLYLEYKSYLQQRSTQEVRLNIFKYVFNGYGYENLRILFTEIFVHEEYQYFTGIKDGDVITDCGANIGMATLYLKWRFPGAVIHAFEPDPAAFAMLQKNVQQNQLSQVILHNEAAMDQKGKLQFFVSDNQPASLMMSTLSGRMSERMIETDAIDFSEFVAQTGPLSLKIDIEGAEQQVFNRLAATGAISKIRQIIMEYHHKIDKNPSSLSAMLSIFEQNGLEYNLITQFTEPGKFQDILIYAYRP